MFSSKNKFRPIKDYSKNIIYFFPLKQLKHHEITNIKTTFPIVVICDNFHSPGNVGMAFRICEIMGVQQLYLTGDCPIPPNKNIRKTARTAEKNVNFTVVSSTKEAVQALKKEGYTLLGIEITDKSQNLHNFDFKVHQKIALVLGAERFGIDADVLQELDFCLHIPMYGDMSSMNVVMAMSISLYEATKQLFEVKGNR